MRHTIDINFFPDLDLMQLIEAFKLQCDQVPLDTTILEIHNWNLGLFPVNVLIECFTKFKALPQLVELQLNNSQGQFESGLGNIKCLDLIHVFNCLPELQVLNLSSNSFYKIHEQGSDAGLFFNQLRVKTLILNNNRFRLQDHSSNLPIVLASLSPTVSELIINDNWSKEVRPTHFTPGIISLVKQLPPSMKKVAFANSIKFEGEHQLKQLFIRLISTKIEAINLSRNELAQIDIYGIQNALRLLSFSTIKSLDFYQNGFRDDEYDEDKPFFPMLEATDKDPYPFTYNQGLLSRSFPIQPEPVIEIAVQPPQPPRISKEERKIDESDIQPLMPRLQLDSELNQIYSPRPAPTLISRYTPPSSTKTNYIFILQCILSSLFIAASFALLIAGCFPVIIPGLLIAGAISGTMGIGLGLYTFFTKNEEHPRRASPKLENTSDEESLHLEPS